MKVQQKDVDHILMQSTFEDYVFFNKCLVLSCKLPNGFVIIGVGCCVDPKEFNKEIGMEVAMKQIVDKIWELLGYQLQDKMLLENLS